MDTIIPGFEVNFRRSALPVGFAVSPPSSAAPELATTTGSAAASFAGVPLPTLGLHPLHGLRLPLEAPGEAADAGLCYAPVRAMPAWNDSQGCIQIAFNLIKGDQGGLLAQSWGGYLRIAAEVQGDRFLAVKVHAYGHDMELHCPEIHGQSLIVQLDYHHRVGLAVTLLSELGIPLFRSDRNISWHAYHLRYIPLELGGHLASFRPEKNGQRRWICKFHGELRWVKCWDLPQSCPGRYASTVTRLNAQSSTHGHPAPMLSGSIPIPALATEPGSDAAHQQSSREASSEANLKDRVAGESTNLQVPPHARAANPAVAQPSLQQPFHLGPFDLWFIRWHDPALIDSRYRYRALPDRESELHQAKGMIPELYDRYHQAKSPLEGLLSVGAMVSEMWPHTEYWPWPRAIFSDPGQVLFPKLKLGQIAGMCGGYAHVMEEALWSLGIPARRVQVANHSSFEAYDFGHDKWICLETDNGTGYAGVWLDDQEVPLSLGECIDLLEWDHALPGTLERRCQHRPLQAACPTQRINNPDPYQWFRFCYHHMGYYRRNDHLPATVAPSSYWYATPSRRIWPMEPYTRSDSQHLVEDWRQLYWSTQRVKFSQAPQWSLSSDQSQISLQMKLEAFETCFADHLRISQDHQTSKLTLPEDPQAGVDWQWRLHPGLNELEIAVVNSLGAIGHPLRASVFLTAHRT